MRVTSIHVANLFSFDTFDLTLDDGLTVIVGPNGAGKTNVVRILELVPKLVEWSDEQTRNSMVAEK
jgi:predicted ATP-binding protein involved in virulence